MPRARTVKHLSHKRRGGGPAPDGRAFDSNRMDLMVVGLHHALQPESDYRILVAVCQYFVRDQVKRAAGSLPVGLSQLSLMSESLFESD